VLKIPPPITNFCDFCWFLKNAAGGCLFVTTEFNPETPGVLIFGLIGSLCIVEGGGKVAANVCLAKREVLISSLFTLDITSLGI